jgi:hypothetical protein
MWSILRDYVAALRWLGPLGGEAWAAGSTSLKQIGTCNAYTDPLPPALEAIAPGAVAAPRGGGGAPARLCIVRCASHHIAIHVIACPRRTHAIYVTIHAFVCISHLRPLVALWCIIPSLSPCASTHISIYIREMVWSSICHVGNWAKHAMLPCTKHRHWYCTR